MRLPFYKSPPECVELDGKCYPLDLAFGKVLRYFDLAKDPGGLSETDISEIALNWFLPETNVGKLDIQTRKRLIEKISAEYISGKTRRVHGRKSVRTVDFNYDSGYIYAAFMQTYGIDLYECADTLQWCKFMSLFSSLPDNTAISQIMSIRAREMPVPDNTNRAEVQRLTELKLLYALPDTGYTENAQETLNSLFDLLASKSKRTEVR